MNIETSFLQLLAFNVRETLPSLVDRKINILLGMWVGMDQAASDIKKLESVMNFPHLDILDNNVILPLAC